MQNKKILIAKCTQCGEILKSLRGGHWVSCKCGNYIDRDRWLPDEQYRRSDNIKIISFK